MIKNRLEYALLLMALGVFCVLYVDYLSFFVFCFFVALPVFSALIALLAARGLTAEFSVPKDHIQKHETLPLRWSVKTRSSLLSCRVRVKLAVRNELFPEAKTEMLVFLSAGRRGQTVEQELTSGYCGKLDCRIQELRIVDALGLCSFRRKTGDRQSCTVYVLPSAWPLKDKNEGVLIPTDSGDGTTQEKPGDDPSEIRDIREFRSGDRLTRVHWKLSSKYGDVMVKEYAHTAASEVLLFFDLLGSGSELSSLLDTVCSVSGFLLEHQVAYDMEWYDSQRGCLMHAGITQEEDLRRVLDAVLAGGRRQAQPMALRSRDSAAASGRYADVIYISSRTALMGETLTSLRDQMAESRIRVLAVTEDAPASGKPDANRAAALDIGMTVIDSRNTGKSLGALVL